ncbi:MAG: hypothetical protein OSA48_01170 [Akkermansiaceae bacterium]|nr:hypothetical protein [Akkermansiaceae bacterium]
MTSAPIQDNPIKLILTLLGVLIATLLSACSSPSSSNAIRTNGGIPIYAPTGGYGSGSS